jgi:hypothetical protein
MNRTNSAETHYGTPLTGKGATARAQAGRLCAVADCGTLISTYNSASTCWLHSSPTHRHALATR